jgi:hypothetical protein
MADSCILFVCVWQAEEIERCVERYVKFFVRLEAERVTFPRNVLGNVPDVLAVLPANTEVIPVVILVISYHLCSLRLCHSIVPGGFHLSCTRHSSLAQFLMKSRTRPLLHQLPLRSLM